LTRPDRALRARLARRTECRMLRAAALAFASFPLVWGAAVLDGWLTR
jgi:hypothetical protein